MQLLSSIQKVKANQLGQTLIELLVTIGLAAILMPAFLTGFYTSRTARPQQDRRLQAILYVREAEEAIRIIRDNGWTSVTNGVAIGAAAAATTYCPQQVPSGTTWELVSLSDPTKTATCDTPASGFSRTITIVDAYRDATTHQIVLTGGVDDPSTKAITITVSWTTPISSSVSQTLYLTRHDNLSYLDTSVSDFTAGDTSGGTAVTNMFGGTDGEVRIGGGGSSDWCKPDPNHIVKYKQTGNGQEIAISAVAPNGATNGYAYTTFGNNQSGHPLDSLSVTDASTPVVSAGSSFTADAIKTYGLYADPTAPYVYMASDSNSITVDVIHTTDYTQHVATLKITGENGNTVSLGTINNTKIGFVATTKNTSYFLHAFKTNNGAPSGTLSTTGPTITLSGQAQKIVVVGNYVYIVTNSTSNKLQIIDATHIADASSPTMSLVSYTWKDGKSMSSYQSVPQGGTDLAVDSSGQYVFISTSVVSSNANDWDAFMINVQTPTTPLIVSGYNTYPMSPLGILTVEGHMIVVGNGAPQYQVFYTSPKIIPCPSGGTMTLSGGTKITAATAVSEADSDNFAYIITDDSTGWFQIVPGGSGPSGGSGGGIGQFTFVSQGLPVPNLTSNATFNSFFPIADTPSGTSIGYQLGVSSSCTESSFTFYGPNGTSANTDLYATSSAIPITTRTGYLNPGLCFRYKAYLSTTTAVFSPILYQVNVNYSP